MGCVSRLRGRLTAAPSAASSTPAGRLDSLPARCHEIGIFDGVAMVVKGDEILPEKGHGLASREFAVPNAPDAKAAHDRDSSE